MEKKFNFVYLTTNLINGKQYIGDRSTNKDPEKDSYIGSGIYFKNALKQYGKENFKREILEYYPNKNEAFLAQEKYIIQFNTLSPNGYNLSPKGGHGVSGCWGEESKKKLSKNHARYWKGKKQSEESVKKRSLSNTGKHRTEESKKKLSKALTGVKHSEERRKHESESHKGQIPWNKGKKCEQFAGENNAMYGISVYDIWVQKFGIEEAEKRKEQRRIKLSNSLKGKNIGKSKAYDVWVLKYGIEEANKRKNELHNLLCKDVLIEIIDIIIDLYVNKNMSAKNISLYLNKKYGYNKVISILRENNIAIKSRGKLKR